MIITVLPLQMVLMCTHLLFILNNTNRRVPTREAAWVDDGLDIRALLGEFFTLREQGIPADHVTPSNLRNVVFWGCYQKPG